MYTLRVHIPYVELGPGGGGNLFRPATSYRGSNHRWAAFGAEDLQQ